MRDSHRLFAGRSQEAALIEARLHSFCTAYSCLIAPTCLLPAAQVDLKHDLNARDYLGRTPLHYAAMHGRVGMGRGRQSGRHGGRGGALCSDSRRVQSFLQRIAA